MKFSFKLAKQMFLEFKLQAVREIYKITKFKHQIEHLQIEAFGDMGMMGGSGMMQQNMMLSNMLGS